MNLVCFLSVYKLVHSSDYGVQYLSKIVSVHIIDDVTQSVQHHEDVTKAHSVRQATFIRSTCNNAVNMRLI